MRIILVRHGESQANVDQNLHRIIPDHEVALSTRGQEQAKRAADEIIKFYASTPEVSYSWQNKFKTAEEFVRNIWVNGNKSYKYPPKITLWNSPYRRTRDTANIIAENLGKLFYKRKENVLLCEQQFGLFDGIPDEELKSRYPNEFETWHKCRQYNGKFWARYPQGESAFDAAVRIHQAFGSFHRDNEKHEDTDHIIVCHGTVAKLFVMMWFHYPFEWYEKERTIGNCGLYLIENGEDKGWVFPGFKRGELAVRYE